ncbi:DUF3891 family protein [Chloroflexi bacterium TSY]|nr:DUF3891 family protein [Chloroflexi bacterium TSY]
MVKYSVFIKASTHAVMAAAFCRHWGNADFARPKPYEIVMLAIEQHDNGWYEWELSSKLRADGYPMDFIHDDDPFGKIELWRRGINRAYAQHPYAAIRTYWKTCFFALCTNRRQYFL